MNRKVNIKTDITVAKIGVLRFWLGIAVGILFGLSLCLFFNYSREILRYFTGAFGDLIVLDKSTSVSYNVFFASLSAALGFSMTFWFWMSGTKAQDQKHRLSNRLSVVNSSLSIWVSLMVIGRLGHILFWGLYTNKNYDSELVLMEDFNFLFYLLPLVIFFQNWISVRRVSFIKKWIGFSFLGVLMMSAVLYLVASVHTDVVDDNYTERHQKEYQYIDSELQKAKDAYGISFSPRTVTVLKQKYTKSSLQQVREIREAFASGRVMSLDTIILQRLIINNFKIDRSSFRPRNSFEDWSYAKPIDIQRQILVHQSDPQKLQELEKLLNEQIDLLNHLEKKPIDFETMSQVEILKRTSSYRMPKVVISQMTAILNELNDTIETNALDIQLDEIRVDP